MWSKGFAAEETKVAFARAAELAAKSGDFSERFAAAHGQWTMAHVRGELTSARELTSTFLREAEEARRVTEAGVARRGNRLTPERDSLAMAENHERSGGKAGRS
jgi:hypothetical protein